MEYQEFKKCVVDSLEKELQGAGKIEIHRVQKNNRKELDGLMVLREGCSVAPALYLNEYYDDYQKGCTLGSIVGEITDFYKYGKDDTKGIDMDFYRDYEKVKEHVMFRVINYEKNRELLEKVPYIHVMDLAMVFYCKYNHSRLGNIMILIYNSHLQMWKVEAVDLYEDAMENTPKKLPVELRTMAEIMRESIMGEELELTEKELENFPMDESIYVLTNYLRQYGAAAMFYPNVLNRFSMAVGGDFYIIPSSVHEVLLLPARDYKQEHLQQMVVQVNETQVAPEEVLSNSVYRYSKKLKKILYQSQITKV